MSAWQGSTRGKSTGTRKWHDFAKRIRLRDGNRCVKCGSTDRLSVDHIFNVKSGGAEYDPANCQTLCHACHAAKTSREAAAARPSMRRKPERHPGLQ